MTRLVEIDNLNIRFSGERTVHAVNDLSLSLGEGEVLGLLEALTSQRAAGTGMVLPPQTADGRQYVLAPPYRIDGRRMPVRRRPPALAADTGAVLGDELKRPAEEIAALTARAVVR